MLYRESAGPPAGYNAQFAVESFILISAILRVILAREYFPPAPLFEYTYTSARNANCRVLDAKVTRVS